MKTTLLCSLCMVLIGTKANREVSVGHAVEKLRMAMVVADGAVLSDLVSPILSYGHSNGVIENKEEFIVSLVSGKYNFLSIDLADQTITVTGNIAVVRHQLSAETEDAGKPWMSIKLHVLTVWQKEENGWVLVARQAVKI